MCGSLVQKAHGLCFLIVGGALACGTKPKNGAAPFEAGLTDASADAGVGGGITPISSQDLTDIERAACASETVSVACTVPIPPPGPGNICIYRDVISFIIESSAGTLNLVGQTGSDCPGDGFYIGNGDGGQLLSLCPKTCATVSADPGATIQVYANNCSAMLAQCGG